MQVVVKAKPIQRSLTIIFNVAAVAAVVLVEVQDLLTTAPEGSVPEWTTKAIVIVMGIVNIILRFRTVIPVALSTQPGAQAVPAPDGGANGH